MSSAANADAEKGEVKHPGPQLMTSESSQVGTVAEIRDTEPSWRHKLRRFVQVIGAEERGITRIEEHERTDMKPWALAYTYYGGNCNSATLATGFLGPTAFGLGWWDSFMAVLVFNFIGVMLPTVFGIFGPKLGLRTMVSTRYTFGWHFAKVLAVLNIIQQIGWGVVNALAGANILYDVGGGSINLSVAVFIVAILAVVVGFMGNKAVTTLEKYSWVVCTLAFIFLAGFGAEHFVNTPMAKGSEAAGSILSFGTVIIGYEVAWSPVASDYGVYIRHSVSGREVFGWTFLGLFMGQVIAELLGVAVGTLIASSDARFTDAYNERGFGGLIGSIFNGRGSAAQGFGKFIEVVLAISVVSVIVFGVYSIGLSLQIISSKAVRVSRLIWTLLGSAIILGLAIAGRNSLTDVMVNFLSSCAYWLTPFSSIMVFEHFIFRRGYNYNLDAWNKRDLLPRGYAAIAAFIISTALAVLSMSTGWWVGPIAKAAGNGSSGVDISWILALAASAVVYPPLRYWERKKGFY